MNRAYLRQLEELSGHQKKCQEHIKHQRYRIGVLSRNLHKLGKAKDNEEQIRELQTNILKRKAQLYEVEQTLPKENGLYLKIILGNVNVSILNKEDKWVQPVWPIADDYSRCPLVAGSNTRTSTKNSS